MTEKLESVIAGLRRGEGSAYYQVVSARKELIATCSWNPASPAEQSPAHPSIAALFGSIRPTLASAPPVSHQDRMNRIADILEEGHKRAQQ